MTDDQDHLLWLDLGDDVEHISDGEFFGRVLLLASQALNGHPYEAECLRAFREGRFAIRMSAFAVSFDPMTEPSDLS